MEIKSILIMILLFVIYLIAAFSLNHLASGDKEKLLSWFLTLYKIGIPLSLAATISVNYLSDQFFDPKSYFFVYLNVLVGGLGWLVRNINRSPSKKQILALEQKLNMVITLGMVAVPVCNVLYFIMRLRALI